MTQYVGAIDQGTTSSRFVIFDRTGHSIAQAQAEHRQITPRPGWVEHDATEIRDNTLRVIREALARAGLSARDLAAVGIANQRETTILWDRRTGEPVHNALVWQDTRVQPLVEAMARDGGPDRFRATTGLPLSTYFSALKIRWLLDEVPGAASRAANGDIAFGTVDSWIAWHLTGQHLTDVTNASRTQLMNLATLDWDDALLSAFSIPRAILPRIVPSSAVLGEATGDLAGVPVAGILGDQQAALMGQGCFRAGDAKSTYGTGCFLLMNTGSERIASTSGLVTTVACRIGDAAPTYALEGSVAISGALVQWLRDNLGMIGSSAEVEELARTVPDNGDVYFVPAFSGLYAPYWRDDAQAVLCGMTRFTRRGHIARAVLEATAFQTWDVVRSMQADSGHPLNELRVDGGMTVNHTLMQFQADILGLPVVRPADVEATALGAAYAAGLAVGFWSGLDELAAHRSVARTWTPSMDPRGRDRLLAGWRKAIERALL